MTSHLKCLSLRFCILIDLYPARDLQALKSFTWPRMEFPRFGYHSIPRKVFRVTRLHPDMLPSPGSSKSFTFLPVNSPGSPNTHRVRRGNQSCDNCRDKKKRCEEPFAEGGCRKCQEESKPCLTTRRRKKRKLVVQQRRGEGAGVSETHPFDNGNARAETLGDDQERTLGEDGSSEKLPSAKEQIMSTNLLDARDALDLIDAAGSREHMDDNRVHQKKQEAHQNRNVTQSGQNSGPASSPKSSLDGFFLVRKGILRPSEVREYLDFYFRQLWDSFPVIPRRYSTSNTYELLANREPVLVISLVALASRYHHLSGPNGAVRSERIHWRAWPWVQRLFQSAMWGSSVMRSYGAIAALLLFIEWHPKAINFQEDFLDDYGETDLFESQHHGPDGQAGEAKISPRLSLVATAYRSNKVSWSVVHYNQGSADDLGSCFRPQSHSP